MKSSENIYWCSIPSDILGYPSSVIPDGAKLLFGVLFNLSKKEGYCYCSNKYLCKVLSISDRSVNRYLYALEVNGYIQIKPNPRDRRSRVIYIAQKKHNCYLKVDTDVHPGHECLEGGVKNDTPVNLSEDFVEKSSIDDNLSEDFVDKFHNTDKVSVEYKGKKGGKDNLVHVGRHFAQLNRQFDGQNNISNNNNNLSTPSSIDEVKEYISELEEFGIGIALSASKFYRYWCSKDWQGIDGVKITTWKELYKQCNHNYKKKKFGIY